MTGIGKLILSIALASACVCNASAQWYLYAPKTERAPEEQSTREKIQDLTAPEILRINLMLPLGSTTQQPDSHFFDFYSGVLMAVRSLGKEGHSIELNVIDILEKKPSASILSRADLNIGPIKPDDLKETIAQLPIKSWLISPLDPMGSGLADSLRIIQAPTGSLQQIDEVAEWLSEDYIPGSRVIVVRNENSIDKNTAHLIERLSAKGVPYSTTYNVLAFKDNTAEKMLFACVSNNNETMVNAAKLVSSISVRNGRTCLYTTSKVRSLDTVSNADLFNARTKMAATYHIDYSNEEVKKFILAYRAFFGIEPTQFAFSGYDTVQYFSHIILKYGKNWTDMISEYTEKGFQTDFKFTRDHSSVGVRNTAVRRIVYNKQDMSMTLQ